MNAKGYVDFGGRGFVHIEMLRDEVALPYLANHLGITVEQLHDWARGPGFTLGLSWAFPATTTA